MTANQGRGGRKVRRSAHSHRSRPHERVVQSPGASSESTQTPGSRRESEEKALCSDGPDSGAVLPCGARLGDPAIWTPLPPDPEEEPVLIARSKRNIPQQVISYEKREYAEPRRAEQEIQGPAKPRIELRHFPRLPIELRFKVYRYASLVPRIIALEFKHHPQDPAVLDAISTDLEKKHRKARACPRSRVPPLMHVYQESRQECMKLYTKVVLSGSGAVCEDYIFVNPCVDTLHFGGDNFCARAIRTLLLINGGHVLPRLSIDISGSEALCCTRPNFPFRNARAVELLCSLHGYWLEIDDQSDPIFHHFKGLTDLSFVVGSNITHMPPKLVDYKSNFRPAVTNGVSSREIIFKGDLDFVITCVNRGLPHHFAQQFWRAETLPSIDFVSFGPEIDEDSGRVMDIMTAQAAAVHWLDYKRKSFLDFGLVDKLERQHRCQIIINDPVPFHDEKAEIGIKGTKEDVERCRESLRPLSVNLQRSSLETWFAKDSLPLALAKMFSLLVFTALFLMLMWHLGLLHMFGEWCVAM